MIRLFTAPEGRLTEVMRSPDHRLDLTGVVWIDLVNPTRAEEEELEEALGLGIPTRDEMAEIEASSRLYGEQGALFMTANILSRPTRDMTQAALDGRVVAMPITFVLAERQLLTVRYHEPRSVYIFQGRAERGDLACHSPVAVLMGLFEVIIDRLADMAEDADRQLDVIGAHIFDTGGQNPVHGDDLDAVLEHIGRAEDMNGKMAASIATLERLVTGMTTMAASDPKKDSKSRLKIMTRDLRSVSDHVVRQSGRITFLLDSTLGKINIEQSRIIKIFSVMSMVFLPPTLIASIYGMNFEDMPELAVQWAYPAALVAMVLSAVGPYWYFRRRGWL